MGKARASGAVGIVPPGILSPAAMAVRVRVALPGPGTATKAGAQMVARTCAAALFVDAVGGRNWLRPCQVVRLSDRVLATADGPARWAYARRSPQALKGRWYAENTREDIRDAVIKAVLLASGAMIEREGLSNNSGKGRYSLSESFASLLLPDRIDWREAANAWRASRPDPVVRPPRNDVALPLPGDVRHLSEGPGSRLTASFLARYLPDRPDTEVVSVADAVPALHPLDAERLGRLRLSIDANKLMPDVVLVDGSRGTRRLVFVEVVATGGWFTRERVTALSAKAAEAGFGSDRTEYLSVFTSRSDPLARKALSRQPGEVGMWFADEPELGVLRFERVPVA